MKFCSLDFCRCWKYKKVVMVRGEGAWNHFQTCSKVDFLPEASSRDCHSDHRAPAPSAFPLLLVALYQPGGLDATTTLRLDKKTPGPFSARGYRQFPHPLSTGSLFLIRLLCERREHFDVPTVNGGLNDAADPGLILLGAAQS